MKHLFDIGTKFPKLNPLRTEPLPSDYWITAAETGVRQQLALIHRLTGEMWTRDGLLTSLERRNKSFINPMLLDVLRFDTSTGMGKVLNSWGIGRRGMYAPKSSIGPLTFSFLATIPTAQHDLRVIAEEWCEEIKQLRAMELPRSNFGGDRDA